MGFSAVLPFWVPELESEDADRRRRGARVMRYAHGLRRTPARAAPAWSAAPVSYDTKAAPLARLQGSFPIGAASATMSAQPVPAILSFVEAVSVALCV